MFRHIPQSVVPTLEVYTAFVCQEILRLLIPENLLVPWLISHGYLLPSTSRPEKNWENAFLELLSTHLVGSVLGAQSCIKRKEKSGKQFIIKMTVVIQAIPIKIDIKMRRPEDFDPLKGDTEIAGVGQTPGRRLQK